MLTSLDEGGTLSALTIEGADAAKKRRIELANRINWCRLLNHTGN
jgi:hypothetical protein